MSKEVIISERQTLQDIAIQETGSVETVFDIAEANGLSVSDVLAPGLKITIPDGLIVDADVVNYFQSNKLFPANGDSIIDETEILDGIDYWAIEEDFMVS